MVLIAPETKTKKRTCGNCGHRVGHFCTALKVAVNHEQPACRAHREVNVI